MTMKRVFLGSLDEWSGTGVLSLMGPTGSGKTSTLLAHLRKRTELQEALLVSVDAVAVYRGLDIGSAKAMGPDRDAFDWAGLDFKNPDETCTVRDFLDAVETPIAEALEEGRPVVLVGGSGFYENALVEGLAPGAASDPDFQKQLEAHSNETLHKRLVGFDKRWGEFLHSNDRYRLTRYLDLVERQGFNWTDLRETKRRNDRLKRVWSQTSCVVLGLEWSREIYLERLTERISQMWSGAWLSEVRELLEHYPPNSVGLQTIGYKEVVQHVLDPKSQSEERTKELILFAHLQYVKRQKTWLRGLVSAT
jgi:tRNA dimethylallyltransferase